MRILHVVTNLWRCNGVMSVVMNYLRSMPEDIRFDLLYFTELENNYREELEALGGKAVRIATPGLHSFRRDDVDTYLAAHRGEYAAIHLHLPYLASVFAPKARKYGIPKVFVHCHSTWFSLNKRNDLRNRLLNLPTKRLADGLLACGRDAGFFWYGARAMERGEVNVLPNAVDTERLRFDPARRAAARAALGLGEELTVGHVGTLTTPKNHQFLLPVFSEIRKARPDAVLLLAGEGPLRPQVEEQIRALGLDGSVRLLGNRRDVPDLLQAMDLFLFPSLHEGLPVSVVEAQAAGLPVLMSAAVTDEVCVTGARIARLSLNEPPERWAERALALAGLERIDTAGMVAENGFDLRRNAARLAELYGR